MHETLHFIFKYKLIYKTINNKKRGGLERENIKENLLIFMVSFKLV